jgi:hydrogenase maturation protease
MHTKTLIIGLGNTILSDDGAGILAAREVKNRCHGLTNLDVVEASLGGIGLLDLMAGYEKVIIIDSIKTMEGKPGDIFQLSVEDLGDTSSYPCSPHFLDVRTAVELGEKIGYKMPEHITIYAVEIKDNTTFSKTLTPEVKKAIPELVSVIIEDCGFTK